MSMILLAVEDTDRDAPIRDLLTAEGWWVTTVNSREEALRAAADHAPQLLIIDKGLTVDDRSLRVFLRDGGGCAVLVLIDSQAAAGPAVAAADGWLGRDQEPAALVAVVRSTLGRPRRASEDSVLIAAPADAEEQLTARDLFGDILEDLGEETAEEEARESDAVTTDEAESAGDEGLAASSVVAEVEALVELLQPIETEGEAVEVEAQEPPLVAAVEEAEDFEVDLEEATAEESLDVVTLEEVEDIAAEQEVVELAQAEPEGPLDVVAEEDLEEVASEPEGVEVEAAGPEIAEPEEPLTVVAAEEVQAADAELEAGELDEVQAQETEAETIEPEDVEGEQAETVEAAAEETAVETSDVIGDELGATLPAGELDAGEPSTDLVAEVADLLESGRSAWLTSDEPDGDVGLSIEEVLAVQEATEEVPAAQAAAATAGDSAKPEPTRGTWYEEVDEDLERVGPYALVELIEFGDLTERWLARRSDGQGERVVVERVRRELRNRADVRAAFVEGFSEAAGWEHESVLRVVDLGRDGDIDFVATEFRPGHSLREILDRVRRMEARMPMGVSLLVMERLVAALEVLAQGPTSTRHGWVVPGSVWLTDDGAVLLREFGFGRLPAAGSTLALDWSEHRFMAPERWSSRGDLRSDLYSLGALLYEMMCGHPVHRAPDFELLVDAISEVQIVPSQLVDPTIPAEIDAWVMRLLRRNPEERPQSVAEVGAKIDLALQALPARPATADLSAYVRQIFAARVPKEAEPEEAAEPVETGDEGEAGAASEVSQARRLSWWWWLLIPLLTLLSAYVGWRTLGAGATAEVMRDAESRQAQAAPAPAPAPHAVSAGAQVQ